ncbi:MAG: AbrB/MazE/SpoVT family DNA-binding domain-containing protein [Thaumarchaeota archaeon]|nr:AbrB/MazE/SpoVT family DNA-binding domain-containing protein [Nitrososphaerota archaeon]
MSIAKVKRKGQVTIPAKLRSKFGIDEGTILEVSERPEGILLRPLPPPKPGEVVGEETYRRLVQELDSLRRRWR